MRKLSLLLLLLVLHLAMYGKGDKSPSLSQRPLSFLENKGQLFDQYGKPRTDIDFILYTKEVTLFIGKGTIQYQFVRQDGPGSPLPKDPSGKARRTMPPVTTYRLDVSLEGANTSATVVKDEQRKEAFRYYTGNTSPDGITDVHAYGRVTYKDIYPGIDWVLYTADGKLKYDFVIHPGGKVSSIRMRYEGADKIAIGKDGSLAVITPLGNVEEGAPYSYEQGAKKAVTSRYILKDNIVSYEASTYAGTLVIDPTVQWATYFGGPGDEYAGYDMAVDTFGYVYISGVTTSTSVIATSGAHQTIYGGGFYDGYIAKFDSMGQLQWATYYGGSGSTGGGILGGIELECYITCDSFGHVYISGSTNSEDGIATPGSFQDIYVGDPSDFGFSRMNGYLVQFNNNGIRQWGTYYGGNEDYGIHCENAPACDEDGNVYVSFYADSNNAAVGELVTTGAYQTQIAGNKDALLVKFDNAGNRLWATYYGGETSEYTHALTCKGSDVYIGGRTNSLIGIATTNGYLQTPSINMANDDGFVAKFSGDGALVWSTYIHGTVLDLHLDRFNHLYVVGQTQQHVDTTISSPGSWLESNQQFSGAMRSGFIMSFNADSCTRNWGTLFAATNGITTCSSIASDTYGKIFIAGCAQTDEPDSTYTIASPGSWQDTTSMSSVFGDGGSWNGGDVYVAQFDTFGMRKWGSYYARGSVTSDPGIVCDRSGALYLTGTAQDDALNTATPGVYQEMLGGGQDAFLVRWLPVDIGMERSEPAVDTVCTGDVPLTVQVTNHGRVNADTITITYTYTGPTEGSNTLSFTDGLPAGASETYDLGTLPLTVEGNYEVTVYLHYTKDDAERSNDTLHFTLTTTTAEPVANIEYSQVGTNYQFSDPDGLSSYTYHWDFGDGNTSSEAVPTHSYAADGTYDVTLIVTGWCGSDTAHLSLDAVGTGTAVSGIADDNLLTVYPNPSKDGLYIKTSGITMKRYEVVNALGQTVLNGTLNGQQDKINVSGLAAGAYYIRIDTNKGIAEKPFQVLR